MYISFNQHFCIPVILIKQGCHIIIMKMHFWLCNQIHAPENTREPPHVLVLKKSTVRITEHLNCNIIFS